MMTPLLQSWALRQNNRTEADELRRLAKQAGALDPEAWAARVLACSQKQDSNVKPLDIGRAIALAQQLASGAKAIDVHSVRELARTFSTPRTSIPPVASSSTAATKLNGSPDTTWRRADVARAAFNYPGHWLNVEGGKVAPNEKRFQGEALRAWSAVTQKFGSDLAKTLFDAKARGGNAMAVINAMQAAGSSKTLTIRDLSQLQYAVITDGRTSPLAVPLDEISLHEAFHDYGTSVFEEIFGDGHSEELVATVFGQDSKVALDLDSKLFEQPDAVRQINEAIEDGYASIKLSRFRDNIKISFFESRALVSEERVFKNDWTRDPKNNANLALEILNANGLLSHLNLADRQKISRLLYDGNNPESLASISKDFQRTRDGAALARRMVTWTETLGDTIVEASQSQMMTKERFREYSAQALAMALTLERAAPGVLPDGPLLTGLSNTDLPLAVRQLDLCKSYPATLREVRQALGLQP